MIVVSEKEVLTYPFFPASNLDLAAYIILIVVVSVFGINVNIAGYKARIIANNINLIITCKKFFYRRKAIPQLYVVVLGCAKWYDYIQATNVFQSG